MPFFWVQLQAKLLDETRVCVPGDSRQSRTNGIDESRDSTLEVSHFPAKGPSRSGGQARKFQRASQPLYININSIFVEQSDGNLLLTNQSAICHVKSRNMPLLLYLLATWVRFGLGEICIDQECKRRCRDLAPVVVETMADCVLDGAFINPPAACIEVTKS